MLKECLENVREKGPLVHCITNHVTINDVANIILACGGSPIMAESALDAHEIVKICDGLTINIGNIDGQKAMMLAGKKAKELEIPRVLDCVGVGASSFRTALAKTLMDEIDFTVIKGNASEIKSFILGTGETQGVDASDKDMVCEENIDENVKICQDFSKKKGTIVLMTGPIDVITSADQSYIVRNGREEMTKVTGTGCSLSGLLTAFLAANPKEPLKATLAATCAMGLAGEVGYGYLKEHEGNATYRNRIIDGIYGMTGEQLEKEAKYESR